MGHSPNQRIHRHFRYSLYMKESMTNHTNHLSCRSCFSEVDKRNASRARASIQYSGSSEDIPITLRDVSVFGAGFFTSEPPQLRSRVMFTLRGQGQSERLRATIMWSLPAGEGWWRAGCRFQGQLSTDFIDIATVPKRQATSIRFQIRRELNPEIYVAAKVVGFSDGGLCVRSAEAFPKGSKLLFETQEIDPSVRFRGAGPVDAARPGRVPHGLQVCWFL